MSASSVTSHSWLDRLAISMAVVCGIHCLVTPVLLVALPILATTFWVDENFHLWMLLLVIPTTSLAVWTGCRRHKDRWVLAAAALGMAILVAALLSERMVHAQAEGQAPVPLAAGAPAGPASDGSVADPAATAGHAAEGGCCALHPREGGGAASEASGVAEASTVRWPAWLNAVGGMFLVVGHSRNFLLCRRGRCEH